MNYLLKKLIPMTLEMISLSKDSPSKKSKNIMISLKNEKESYKS